MSPFNDALHNDTNKVTVGRKKKHFLKNSLRSTLGTGILESRSTMSLAKKIIGSSDPVNVS